MPMMGEVRKFITGKVVRAVADYRASVPMTREYVWDGYYWLPLETLGEAELKAIAVRMMAFHGEKVEGMLR